MIVKVRCIQHPTHATVATDVLLYKACTIAKMQGLPR